MLTIQHSTSSDFTYLLPFTTGRQKKILSNLDYLDSLGLDEIVWIIEGLDNRKYEYNFIYEEQNCLNKATFNHEATLLQIIWKTIWSTVHLEPLNSEPIRTHLSVLH